MFKQRLSVVMMAALLCPTVIAAEVSGTIFFGDSLTDSGAYAPSLSFTTNPDPVWAEILAEQLGHSGESSVNGGTNYAWGGARIAEINASSPAAIPIKTQVDNYLTANGSARGDVLYTLWGGANDILALAPSADPLDGLNQAIAAQVAAISSLKKAGAKYILVPNIPDIGITPGGVNEGDAAAAGLTLLSEYYNGALYRSLNIAGIKVIPVDMMGLLREVSQSPSVYGFSNITVPICGAVSSLICTPADYIDPANAATYLYADGIHPTGAGHQLMSDYVYSVITAGEMIAQAATQGLYTQRGITRDIHNQSLRGQGSSLDEAHVWASGTLGQQAWNEPGSDRELGYSAGIGIAKRLDDRRLFGIAFHSNMRDSKVGDNQVDLTAGTFSLYGGYHNEAWNLSGVASIGSHDYDLERSVRLGPNRTRMNGSTGAVQFSAGAELRYLIQRNRFSHGPVVGLQLQHLSIDGYTEQATSGQAAAIRYSSHDVSSTLATLGWQAKWALTNWQPYADVRWYNELNSDNEEVGLALATLPNNRFTLPVSSSDEQYGNITLGVDTQLSENVNASFELNHLFGHQQLDDTSVTVSLHYPF